MTTKKFSLDVFDTVKSSNAGYVLHFNLPASEEPAFNGDVPLTMKVQGIESDAYTKHIAWQERQDKNESKDSRNDPERDIKRDIALYCAVVTGWTGFPNSDGTGMQKFSIEALREVLTQYADFRHQLRNCLVNRKNFIGN